MPIIETNQRFSQSLLWQLQRAYFEQAGMDAWREGTVPQYITSNPFVARAYAQVIFGWLRDGAAVSPDASIPPLDPNQPIYIVELGAGSGRLAYHFLTHFFGFFDRSPLSHLPVTYVMTDFSQATLDAWTAHPQLQPWVDAGRLDFARFDAEADASLALLHSGQTISAETLVNPLAVIANYFFDGLTHDVFFIEGGQLHESLVTLTVDEAEPDLSDPALLSQINIAFENQPVSDDYYGDPGLDSLLAYYRDALARTYLLFPVGVFNALARLKRLSNGRMLLLSGDKGYHHEADVLLQEAPLPKLHGSFSLHVNYHALGRFWMDQGGVFLSTPHRPDSLEVCVFLLGDPDQQYVEAGLAYDLSIVQGGPDDFFLVKQGLEDHYGELSLNEILGLLRLSGWDAAIYLACVPSLLQQVEVASDEEQEELYFVVYRLWENYFHIGEEPDLAFTLAVLLYSLGYPVEAIEFMQRSLDLSGPDASVYHNMAMCYYELRQLDAALAHIHEALALEPDFEPARAMRIKVEGELQRRR